MKKFSKIRIVVLVLLSICIQFGLLYSCYTCSYTYREQKYYADKDNFITAEGTLSDFGYSKDAKKLFLVFDDLNPPMFYDNEKDNSTPPVFSGNSFQIVGKNLTLVHKRGIAQKVYVGDRISFVTAPEYFGDGYTMPIVALTVNGEDLLLFEEGFDNLQEWLREQPFSMFL